MLFREREDRFIAGQKAEMEKLGHKMTFETEMVLRFAYGTAALEFYDLGHADGVRGQKATVLSALGVYEEELA